MTLESTYSEQDPMTSTQAKALSQETKEKVSDSESRLNATLHGQKPTGDQVQVAFSQEAIFQIENHSKSDLSRELGGALLGHALQQEGSTLVKVLASLPVVSADHGPVHFTFSADSWALLHRDKVNRYPHLDIVGWYHTHPDLGVFFSADDVVVHSAAFVMPWHIGLVVDPVRGEAFLAGWQSDDSDSKTMKLAGIAGFYEVLDLQETSAMGWHVVQSSVWQYGYPSPEDTEVSSQVYAPNSEWPALPTISPWWGVALGGLSLLISILLLIERLLANGG